MISKKLNYRQTGYEIVEQYIRNYWKHNNTKCDVIVSLGISYDGKEFEYINEYAYPESAHPHLQWIEFLFDWWEGQKYINIYGIIDVDKLDIKGGLYE